MQYIIRTHYIGGPSNVNYYRILKVNSPKNEFTTEWTKKQCGGWISRGLHKLWKARETTLKAEQEQHSI